MLHLPPNPPWSIPGMGVIDIDLINNRQRRGYIDRKPVSIDRGSVGSNGGSYFQTNYAPMKDGKSMSIHGSSQNRINDLGLHIERGSTNYLLWSRDLTNAAWVKAGGTGGPTVAKTATTPAGELNTCSTVTVNADGDTITQTLVLASKTLVASVWPRLVSGSGTVTLSLDGNVTTYNVTPATAGNFAWGQTAKKTLSNPSVVLTFTGVGSVWAIDHLQLEDSSTTLGEYATTPIPTTSATGSRTNDAIYAGTAPLSNDGRRIINDIIGGGAPWSMILSFNGEPGSGGPAIIATDMTNPATIKGGCGTPLGTGASNPTANSGNFGRGNWNRAVIICTGAGTKYILNGGPPSALNTGASNVPTINSIGTHFNIGNNGSGTSQCPTNGSLGRVTYIPFALSEYNGQRYSDLANFIY